jgi:3-dehydroquinate synthase
MTITTIPNLTLEQLIPPIYVGAGLLKKAEELSRHIRGRQVLIVSNSTIAQHYLPALQQSLRDFQCETLLLSDGEQYKTLATAEKIFDRLIDLGFNRQCTLIALGGGVIGDLTGFAAACFLRGVNYLHVPTTLLAQVDSSIGGKTGVNHARGKNLIGAFYQPQCIMIDTDTLRTLPAREFNAGMAEVIKHALIADADYLQAIENDCEALITRDSATLQRIIRRSCEIKAFIVQADPKEQTEKRILLNFGHTFAHAIENTLGYGTLLHGEAVAIGMILATKLSLNCGYLEDSTLKRLKQLLAAFNLPTALPESIDPKVLIELFQRDKKMRDQGLAFILLSDLGNAIVKQDVALAQIEQALSSSYNA